SMELHNQGAVLVNPAEIATADLIIDVTLRYLKVDIYMANWADLVVDVRLWPRGGAPVTHTIHTTGSQAAWTSSGYEYYRCLRRCEQRLMRELVDEALRAVMTVPPPPPPPPPPGTPQS